MATNFFNFCRTGSAIDVAFSVGAPGVGCAAGEGRIYTWSVEGAIGSGLLVAWAVAVGFNSMGNGFEISSLGSSTTYFPLPSSVSIGEVSPFFSLGKTTSHISEGSNNPSDNSIKSSINSWCGCC